VITVRPKVAELVFQLYGRSLHPELFQIHQSREIQRGDYSAQVQITSAGHLITWQYRGLLLTEVAASAHHPLPERRRLMSYRIKGQRQDQLQCHGGVSYETRFALEPADEAKFNAYQKELSLQATRQGMLQRFDASGRWGVGAMSYINLDSRDKCLRIQAFHTFPDDCAVLKVQSWFRITS
jgi:hypothetical protein